MSLGQTIKQLRIKKEITQADFAEKLNVHNQTVSRWERDMVTPDFSMLGLISDVLDVSIEQLLGVNSNNESVKGDFSAVKLGNTIKTLRTNANLSQGALSKKIGVTADIVSKWERAIVCPDVDRLVLLAKIFNASPSSIYYGIIVNKKTSQNYNEKGNKNTALLLSIISIILVLIVGVFALILTLGGNDDTTIPTPDVPSSETPNNPGISTPDVPSSETPNNPGISTPEIPEPEPFSFVSPTNLNIILDFKGENGSAYFMPELGRFYFTQDLNFKAQLYDDVYAMVDGKITSFTQPIVLEGDEYIGGIVELSFGHNKITYYSVMLNDDISVGDEVVKGQKIGKVANHSRVRPERYLHETCLHVVLDINDADIKALIVNSFTRETIIIKQP